MRRTYDNDSPKETVEREAIVARIDAWWQAFEGKATIEGRAACKIDDLLGRVSVSDKRPIDLGYDSPRIESDEDEAAFVATETLFGEHGLDRALRLDRLEETVDAAVESIRDQFPPNPHFEHALVPDADESTRRSPERPSPPTDP